MKLSGRQHRANTWYFRRALWGLLVLASMVAAVRPLSAEPNPIEMVRCFFIYAPILEVGKELKMPDIASFAQKRLAWLGGYFQACKNSTECNAAMERNFALARPYKDRGIELKKHLRKAIAAKDQSTYSAAIQEAIACDKILGVKTADVPVLATERLCFSDQELMSVLIEVHMSTLGNLAGTCVGRFPDMGSKAFNLLRQLNDTYRAELAANKLLSLQAFERSHPGHGKEMRDQNTEKASEPSRQAAAAYTRKECENVVSALEATVLADDWHAVTFFPKTVFKQERANTPSCRAALERLLEETSEQKIETPKKEPE